MRYFVIFILVFLFSCSTSKNQDVPPFAGTWQVGSLNVINVPYTDPVTGSTLLCRDANEFLVDGTIYITFTSDNMFYYYYKDSISNPIQSGKWASSDSGFNLINMDTLGANSFINANYNYEIKSDTVIISKKDGACLFECKCTK